MHDDGYLAMKKEADASEKYARTNEDGQRTGKDDDRYVSDTEQANAWLKCIAIRLEMALRHAEGYNGYPGEDDEHGGKPMPNIKDFMARELGDEEC